MKKNKLFISKRSGAGTAYLEYYFDKAVRKFDKNLSYWQVLDRLSKLNSSTDFYVLKHHVDESSDYYYWEHSLDLIDANLTTDRYNQDLFSFNYIGNEVFSFKFYLTSSATGDRNLGEYPWNKRYNNMPRFVLNCKTPNEIEVELKPEFLRIGNEQGQKSPTSIES